MIGELISTLAAGALGAALGAGVMMAHYARRPPRVVFLDPPRGMGGKFVKRETR
jgi:hypothetical protein